VEKEENMKLSAPKVIVWWIALILGLIAIVVFIGIIKIAVIAPHAFWIMTVGWALLVFATFLKGL
jgi:heme A synthase